MDETTSLPTFEQLEALFKVASERRIPPYNWAPPDWDKLVIKDKKRWLQDNCSTPGAFDQKVPAVKERGEKVREDVPKMVNNPSLASPFDDFSHVDPDQLSDDDIDAAEPLLAPDPRGRATLEKLRNLAGSRSGGMKRLETVFRWVLGTFHQLCSELNRAMDSDNGRDLYERLSKAYFNRLRDLDDHEPQTKDKGFDGVELDEIARGKRGYGRAMKWLQVAPVIFGGRIIGLRVIVHWNPHSSSSGVPILHP